MLVPIKPVSCACKSAKFKDWIEGNGDYEVTPLTSFNVNMTVTNSASFACNYTTANDINDSEVTGITVTMVNDYSTTMIFELIEFYDDYTSNVRLVRSVSANQSATELISVTKTKNVIAYQFSADVGGVVVNNNRSKGDFVLSDIITSDLITSTEDEFLNTYYANWCIVDPFDDFATELKVAFALAEDKLRAYKAQLTDFNPGAHTVMSVDYGERGNKEYGYRYPIGGNVDTSAPNTGAKATVDAVTDTTTVDKNDEPFKNLDKTKAMDGWLKFFVDQFKDCFTLCEAMTW